MIFTPLENATDGVGGEYQADDGSSKLPSRPVRKEFYNGVKRRSPLTGFTWESEKDRLKKFMKIPPKQKLEWLYQMHLFILKSSSKRGLALRRKLRQMR
ncbi:MAG: hypothetical protein L6416_06465 [Candidatus Omnitrophica bacterium]|nr:hypothetical protein [Candidatus Omnitrophota bacterium]